ncbi:NUDIX hydrolase [Isoptericola sp. NPDC055881]
MTGHPTTASSSAPEISTTPATTMLHIVAAVIVRDDGRALLVRKRGTTAFMQVGGKIEPGEEPVAALVRECAEEIGLVVDPSAARPLARRAAVAANEPDHVVDAHVFEIGLPQGFVVETRAELEEHVWVDPADPVAPHPLAPLSVDLMADVAAGR